MTNFIVSPLSLARRQSMLVRAGRRLADTWNAQVRMTPQERANAYVARMPISVIAP